MTDGVPHHPNGSDPAVATPPPPPHEKPAEVVLIESLPGLARIAAGAWIRTAAWGVGTSLRLTRRVAEAALHPEAATGLVREFGVGIRAYARELLGIADLDERVRELMPPRASPSQRMRDAARAQTNGVNGSLREQGAELLRQSADITADDDPHPAYARILAELHPDEARMLRLLERDGPQAAVDVRATNLIGVGSQLIARALNMMGTEAGCRHPDRVPAYLNNLQRLGLIWLSDEPVEDVVPYQVIEAQPGTLEAMRAAGRPKTTHRSIRLTPFGADFCRVAIPVQETEPA
jgi:hypothetical protein